MKAARRSRRSPVRCSHSRDQVLGATYSDTSSPWDSDEKLDTNDSVNVIAKDQIYLDQATLILESVFEKEFPDNKSNTIQRRFGLYIKEFPNITDKTIPMSILNDLPMQMPCWYQVEKSKRDSKLTSSIKLNLNWTFRYGVLVDLNRFFYPAEQSWSNENSSSIEIEICKRFGGKESIHWIIGSSENLSEHILKLSNIEASAVITKRTGGFSIYIFQKCNTAQYRSHSSTHQRSNSRGSSARTGSKNRRRKSEQENSSHGRKKVRLIQTMNTYFPNIEFTVQEKSDRNVEQREELIRLYNSLTHALYLARISVFYGNINSRVYNNFNEDSLSKYTFPSFLKNYAWEMLLKSGFRFNVLANDALLHKIKEISEQFGNNDQSFYRVCLYLFHVLRTKPFANIFEEITYAVNKNKHEQVGLGTNQCNAIESTDPSWCYVGAVVITPTTTQVKPLRLCETNRVLRAEVDGKKLFGESWNSFALVAFRDEDGTLLAGRDITHFRSKMLDKMITGFSLGGMKRIYKYLHHSQSQLRQQEFWFYHHIERGPNKNISIEDAYKWMGEFDYQNPAKYAARMAQCFTATTQCVTIPKNMVATIPDIKTPDGKLIFTDGCGRMSKNLQEKIKNDLNIDEDFSLIQIRYGGAKGVLSLDTRMTSAIHICLRPSMIKFGSDCDFVELCQYSRPMPVFLNRQVIFLLSNRSINDNIFTICQQRHQLRLIETLTNNSIAVEVLAEILPGSFNFKKIQKKNIDFIHEIFFRQILIDHCLKVVSSLLQKTRIMVRPSEGRYMFGIADEYGVLEADEVFVQFTHMSDETNNSGKKPTSTTILDARLVLITKNPCHHPGDVRTFMTRDRMELRHLKDVVVFSTKGKRPAPHDISGSDLDGDEYTVIWDPELVPYHTENFEPHDFDAATPSGDHEGILTRATVIERILDNIQNSCLGSLSNIHLAFADKYGISSTEKKPPANLSTIDLAGLISLEVDSAKTGYHPVSGETLRHLNTCLENKRPDYLMKDLAMSYESSHVIGQLYRAIKKTVPIWNRLVQYHRRLGHLEIKINNRISDDQIKISRYVPRSNFSDYYVQEIYALVDDIKKSPNSHEFVKELLDFYRQEVMEILNLHGLSHETDLWSSDGAKQREAEFEGNAYQQFQTLINQVKSKVFSYMKQFCQANCENDPKKSSCDDCKSIQRLIAVISYNLSYRDVKKRTQSEDILSFPWIFGEALLSNNIHRRPKYFLKPLCSGMKYTWQHFTKTRQFLSLSSNQLTILNIDKIHENIQVDKLLCLFIEIIINFVEPTTMNKLENILGIFVLQEHGKNGFDRNIENYKLELKRRKFTETKKHLDLLNSVKWNEEDNKKLSEYFHNILEVCFHRAKAPDGSEILGISERILLSLQKLIVGEVINE